MAGQKKQTHSRYLDMIDSYGHKSHGIETNGSRFATVRFLCSSWRKVFFEKSWKWRKYREKTKKRPKETGKNAIFYSGFTFQNTAAAATLKTNTPTTA